MNSKGIILAVMWTAAGCLAIHAQSIPIGLHINTDVTHAATEHYNLETTDHVPVTSGELKENIRAKINIGYMMPVSKTMMVGISAQYDYNNEHLSAISDDATPTYDNHHSFKGIMNAMYRSTMWNKPLIVFANVSMDVSPWGIERFSGIGAALLMLKATQRTQFGVGPLVIANTTTRIPFLFVATYKQVLSPYWTININYPFFGMQYTPSPKHTLTGGCTYDADYYWVRPASEALPQTAFFRRSILRTGINYDMRVSPTLTFTAQTGWEYTMAGGLYTSSGSRLIHDLDHPNGPYAHLRISFRPETKLTKKIKAMIRQQQMKNAANP